MWKLSNTFLNIAWVKVEVSRETKEYALLDEMKINVSKFVEES